MKTRNLLIVPVVVLCCHLGGILHFSLDLRGDAAGVLLMLPLVGARKGKRR